MTPLLHPLVVRFVSDIAKNKYKRREAKKHSWTSDYYLVAHIESYSETGDGFVVLVNDLGEIWWVSNKDIRVENVEDFTFDKADLQ